MNITRGKFYLFEERVPLRTHQLIRKELRLGRKALYISKNAPELLRSQLSFDKVRLQTKWLTPRIGENYIPPMNLEMLENSIYRFVKKNREGLVIINGLDVLEKWNGWTPILKVLRRVERYVRENDGNLIISLDPRNHFSKKLEKLELISDQVISTCT